MSNAHNEFQPRFGRSVSIDQAAQLLNVSRRTIYNRIKEGRLETIRTAGVSRRVLLASLYRLERAEALPPATIAPTFAVPSHVRS